MKSRRIRKLVNNERKFLWIPGANVSVAARLEGNISIDALKQAIASIHEYHPLVASKVEMDGDDAWFCYDPAIDISLRVVSRNSENQWFKEVVYEQKIPFDRLNGPLIRFILVQGHQESELVVICQHAICDGTALVFLIRDILKLATGSGSEVTPCMPDVVLTDIFSGKNAGLISKIKNAFVNSFISSINKKWRQNRFQFDQEDYKNIQDAFFSKYTLDSVLLELTSDETRTLTVKCREEAVTINSALTTAFNMAYQDIVGQFKKNQRTVAMPFDLRRRLDPPLGDVLCLFVGSIEVKIDYNTKKPFWETVRRFHNEAVKRIESRTIFESALLIESLNPTLADVLLGFTLFAKLVTPDYSRYEKLSEFNRNEKSVANTMASKFTTSLPGTIMTNLGRVNAPEYYGDIRLDKLYFVPSGSTIVPLVLGAVGVSGKLTVTINFLDTGSDVGKKELLEKVRDRALEYLGLEKPPQKKHSFEGGLAVSEIQIDRQSS